MTQTRQRPSGRERHELRKAELDRQTRIKASAPVLSTNRFYILKWVACITMLVFHATSCFTEQGSETYLASFAISRFAMPLFVLCMVESFYFTKNRFKHFVSIIAIAIVVAFPYNYVRFGEFVYQVKEGRNICLALANCFLMLLLMQADASKLKPDWAADWYGKALNILWHISLVGLFAIANFTTNLEYGWKIVLLTYFFSLAHESKDKRCKRIGYCAAVLFTGAVMFEEIKWIAVMYIPVAALIWYIFSVSAVKKFDDRRIAFLTSKATKYFLRYFYPLHFIVLAVLKYFTS